MRYDTEIYFCREPEGIYNSETGDWEDGEAEQVKDYASVTETGTEALSLIYGDIRQGSLTVRIQNHYDEPFDYIRIGSRKYHVDKDRRLREKETFIVSEVTGGDRMKIRLVGDKELYAKLEKAKNMDAVKAVVRQNGAELQEGVQRQKKKFISDLKKLVK